MKIVVFQTVGGFGEGGTTGGGPTHFTQMMRYWSSKSNVKICLLTNDTDRGEVLHKYDGIEKVYILPTIAFSSSLNESALYFFAQMMLNYIVQRKTIDAQMHRELSDDENAIVVATSPYLSDVLAATRASRKFGLKAVIYFHHLSDPPWKFPLRRGPLRSAVNWAMNQLSLLIVKIRGMVPSIDNPKILLNSGWKFETIMPADISLDSRRTTTPLNCSIEFEGCFMGRIAKNKGVIDLINAWGLVIEKFPHETASITEMDHPSS